MNKKPSSEELAKKFDELNKGSGLMLNGEPFSLQEVDRKINQKYGLSSNKSSGIGNLIMLVIGLCGLLYLFFLY